MRFALQNLRFNDNSYNLYLHLEKLNITVIVYNYSNYNNQVQIQPLVQQRFKTVISGSND